MSPELPLLSLIYTGTDQLSRSSLSVQLAAPVQHSFQLPDADVNTQLCWYSYRCLYSNLWHIAVKCCLLFSVIFLPKKPVSESPGTSSWCKSAVVFWFSNICCCFFKFCFKKALLSKLTGHYAAAAAAGKAILNM